MKIQRGCGRYIFFPIYIKLNEVKYTHFLSFLYRASFQHMEWKPTNVTILFVYIQNTRTERHSYWTNGCVNSCTNSPEDGPVGPKHVEIQQIYE